MSSLFEALDHSSDLRSKDFSIFRNGINIAFLSDIRGDGPKCDVHIFIVGRGCEEGMEVKVGEVDAHALCFFS